MCLILDFYAKKPHADYIKFTFCVQFSEVWAFLLGGLSAVFLTALDIFFFTCLSLFDGSPLRLPRQQLNPGSFWQLFQSVSLIAVCRSSSSDLVIRSVVFRLTTTEYWRQINS